MEIDHAVSRRFSVEQYRCNCLREGQENTVRILQVKPSLSLRRGYSAGSSSIFKRGVQGQVLHRQYSRKLSIRTTYVIGDRRTTSQRQRSISRRKPCLV